MVQEHRLEDAIHLVTIPLVTLAVISVGFVLWALKDILVPSVTSLLLVYLLRPIVETLTTPFGDWICFSKAPCSGRGRLGNGMQRMEMESAGGRRRGGDCSRARCPRWLAVCVALLVAVCLLASVVLLIADAIQEFEDNSLDEYEAQAVKLAKGVEGFTKRVLGVDGTAMLDQLKREVQVGTLVRTLAGALFQVLGDAAYIMLFVVYLILEHVELRAGSLREKIDRQIQRYIVLKTVISVAVGVLVYVVLGPLLGVRMAHLFAILTGLANYVPTIGAIVATLIPLPVIVLDPQLSTLQMVLAFVLPTIVHLVVGNVLEPMVFGERFEMHPVTVLVALAFWASLWGVSGAVLSVPITAALRIVLSHLEHPYARAVVALLEGRLGVGEAVSRVAGEDSDDEEARRGSDAAEDDAAEDAEGADTGLDGGLSVQSWPGPSKVAHASDREDDE